MARKTAETGLAEMFLSRDAAARALSAWLQARARAVGGVTDDRRDEPVQDLVVVVDDYGGCWCADHAEVAFALDETDGMLSTLAQPPGEVTPGRRAHKLAELLAATIGEGAAVLTEMPPLWTAEQMRVPPGTTP